MHREEPTLTEDDLAGYPGPALVMVGDRDEEIRPAHTLALFKGLPDAQLAVQPGTGHGGLDTRLVIDFLDRGARQGRPMIARIWSGAVRTATPTRTPATSATPASPSTPDARQPRRLAAAPRRRADRVHRPVAVGRPSMRSAPSPARTSRPPSSTPRTERYLIGGESRIMHYEVAGQHPVSS